MTVRSRVVAVAPGSLRQAQRIVGSRAVRAAEGVAYAGAVSSTSGPPDATVALTIRQCGYDHPDALALDAEVQEYYREIYGSPDTNPIVTDEFAGDRGAFFIGYLGGRAVATGGWRLHDPLPGHPALRPAEIRRMYVVDGVRRLGLARRILVHLETTAAAAGADAMILETGRVQVAAVEFYRRAGYVDVPAFGYYAGAELALHLGKHL